MKRTKYDRELKGPDSYEYFNDLSKLCQSRYLLILKWQLILLLSIAIISSIPKLPEIYTKIKHLIELVLILTVLILMIVQYKSNYMNGWQKSRFLAESILSSSWLLLFKIDIYDNTWNNALTLFHD